MLVCFVCVSFPFMLEIVGTGIEMQRSHSWGAIQ